MRGANNKRTNTARALRKADNDAEWQFWSDVRNRRLNGLKFVRQEPIGRYFADFACRECRLVVELDGSQHADSLGDATRDEYMTSIGWSVARFWSSDFLENRESVLETVVAICEGRLTRPVRSREFNFFAAVGK